MVWPFGGRVDLASLSAAGMSPGAARAGCESIERILIVREGYER
jgi:hypothetical protein